MGETWFTGLADELARCLTDAENCADACEAYLTSVGGGPLIDVLAAPAAVARVLIDLIDQPQPLVLAAVRLCRDLASAAAGDGDVPADLAAVLHRLAESSEDLLESAR